MDARARKLLRWFAREKRDLPWRRTRDPYAIWVSEVMLQQTRVETVVPYYDRFLKRFPDVSSLAESGEDEVLKHWEGLGYYGRARNLHKAARVIASSGTFPRTRDELLALPGFGPYTAGAVASLAFGEEVPAVDGNVRRVFSRLFMEEDVARVPGLVEGLIPKGRARAFNEAVMELGALVCLPRAPRCGECPLHGECEARAEGVTAAYPSRTKRKPARNVEAYAAVVTRGGRLLLERRERGLLAGTWGLPWVEGTPGDLVERVGGLAGAPARLGSADALGEVAWTFTHKRWRLRALRVETRGRGGTWVDPETLMEYGFSAVQRALVDAVGTGLWASSG